MFRVFLIALLATAGYCSAQNIGYEASILAGADRLNDGHSALSTLLRQPLGVAVDSAGNLYISDAEDNRIRKVTAGVITTVAGTGQPGYSGDGGPGPSALIDDPGGIAVDSEGNVYFADRENNVIRMIAPGGTIQTFAGDGGYAYNGEGLPAKKAQFFPQTVAVDSEGNIYLSDITGYRVRKIAPSGIIHTIAGTGTNGYSGDGGLATAANIGVIFGIAVDSAQNIYLADPYNDCVRMVSAAGTITTVAGTGSVYPTTGATPALSTPLFPVGVTVDAKGNLYIADALNDQIFVMTTAGGNISAVAGSGSIGFSGDGGPALAAEIDLPISPVVDSNENLFFADEYNHRVREISHSIVNTVAGAGPGDNGPASAALLNLPADAAYDSAGNLFVADYANGELREVVAPGSTIRSIGQFGVLSANGNPASLAIDGQGNVYTGTDGAFIVKTPPNGESFAITSSGAVQQPTGLVADAQSNLYVADYSQEQVLKVAAAGSISTIAGNGQVTASGDGGPASAAGVDPYDVALDAQGQIYIADNSNNRIRKIGSDGIIVTVAGTGLPGNTGDGGAATSASLELPSSVAVDAQGDIFIGDEGNGVIRRVDGATGTIATIAGTGKLVPFSGASGPARGLNIDPHRVRLDSAGNLIVTDQLNDRIYKLSPVVVTPAQLAIVSGSGQTGGAGTALPIPLIVAVSGSDGFGYAGLTVTFQVISGGATLSPAQATTDVNGNAATSVTLGSQTGPVAVTASAPGLAAVSFSLTAAALPVINAGGIVSAASSQPPVAVLTAGAIVTIFGTDLAPQGTNRQVTQGDFVNGALPTSLAGSCVLIDGAFAPIFYVSPTQINAQVPTAASSSTTAPVQVAINCGQSAEVRSAAVSVSTKAEAPEFFYFSHASNGKNYVAVVNATTGTNIGPAGLIAGANFVPAKPGDVLTAYATGFGVVKPAVAPGVPAPGAASVTATVSMTLGGVALAAPDILYAGVTPTYAGLYQVNFKVPASVAAGDQPLVITIGGVSSPANAVLTIQ